MTRSHRTFRAVRSVYETRGGPDYPLGPKDHVADAAQLMRSERIGAVPSVDGGRLVGILARSDVLDAFVAMSDAHIAG